VGNGTEVSLLKWLQKAEIPIHEVMSTKQGNILAHVPFNSKLKRSIIAVKHPSLEDTVRIYVKGAPEIVVSACKNTYDKEDAVTPEGEKYQRALKVPMSDNAKD
jgi:magnesium-transporting ATPase (P-type)